MSLAAIRGVVRQLGHADGIDSPTDAELLRRFVAERDHSAFAELLCRHGPLVFGVCRRVLASAHDAEDAFQATFLVLAVKANTVRPPGAVRGWLYGVAVRVARKAKVAAARRWKREMAAAQTSREPQRPEWEVAELRAAIDEELGRLPESLRDPLVLCDLGGKTRPEAARELACPEGTVAARLHKARKLLGARLTRRGIVLPVSGLAAVLTPEAVSAELATATLASSKAFASGAASLSPQVRTLTEGVLRTMTARTISFAVGIVLVCGVLAGGWLWGADESAPPAANPARPAAWVPAIAIPPAPAAPAANPWRAKAVLSDLKDSIFSVAFSPDGKCFAAGGDWKGSAAEWHFPSLERRTLYTRDDVRRDPAAVAYSPDSQTRATTCFDGIYWSNRQGLLVLKAMEEPNAIPRAVAFGPYGEAVDGRKFNRLAYTDGRTLWAKTWFDDAPVSTASFGPLKDPPPSLDPLPAAIAWSPSGKQLVFIPNHTIDPDFFSGKSKASKQATHWYALVWGAGSGAAMAPLPHGTKPVTAVAWSPDGNLIATGGADGNVILWDAATPKQVSRVAFGSAVVHGLTFAPDGNTLAAAVQFKGGRSPRRTVLLDVATGAWRHEFTEFPTTPRAVVFSPDGQTLIVGCGALKTELPKDWNPNRDWSQVGTVHVFTTELAR